MTKKLKLVIAKFAKINGAIQVWKSWRDKMLEQGRSVDDKFMSLPIPDRDMELDAQIASDIIEDFITYSKYEIPFIENIEKDILRKQLEVAMKALSSIYYTDKFDEGVYGEWAHDALVEIAHIEKEGKK